MPQDYILARLLSNNAQWADDVDRAEPGFFAQTAKGQSPKVSFRSIYSLRRCALLAHRRRGVGRSGGEQR